MSDDQVTRLRDARKWFNDGQCCGQVDSAGICAAPACIFGEALKEFSQAADRIEAQAAEITRLRAALTTARREGMEEAAKIAEECQRQNRPLSNLGFPERYRAGLAAGAQAIAAAIRAAAKEGKP